VTKTRRERILREGTPKHNKCASCGKPFMSKQAKPNCNGDVCILHVFAHREGV
jgi:hypothetical protein